MGNKIRDFPNNLDNNGDGGSVFLNSREITLLYYSDRI